MGQVWCKNKNWKEQDTNKSPLDRVFLRCAQRIYPKFKDEGLNGATQRVSSSEIGYAGSPSAKELLRSRSISSVDRPFDPRDWVDVNLEVSTTPKATNRSKNNNNLTSTNRSLDLSLYQVKSPAYKNCKTPPVPPPRKKRRKKIRSLPALKINERASRNNIVKSKKDVEGKEKRREFYQHKVNGTGVIIPSKVVSGWKSAEGLSSNQKLPEINNTLKVNNISTSSLPNYDQFKLSQLSNPLSCKDQLKLTGNKSLESLKYCKYQNSSGRKLPDKPSSKIPVIQNNSLSDNKFSGKASVSYPSRNVNKHQESKPERRNKENERNYHSLNGDFDKLKQRDINYLFLPNEITTSRSHPFLNNENSKIDYNSEFRPKLILRRVHSDDNGSLDIMSRSEDFVTKSISEESLPSALMEDDDLNLFEDNSKDLVKNEITKIREELEAVTNEIKTPPRSPEFTKNSTKLRLQEIYGDKENINSMTPSLNEFEATLSELLENNSTRVITKNLDDSYSDSELESCKNLKDQHLDMQKPSKSIPAPPRRKRRKKVKSISDDSGFDFYADRLI